MTPGTNSQQGGTIDHPSLVEITDGQGNTVGITAGALDVNATVNASIAGFVPAAAYATTAVSTTSGNVAIPAGNEIIVYNTGAVAASVALGNTSSVVATINNDQVQPGGWIAFGVGSNTFLAAICGSGGVGTTKLVISGGTGLPAGVGGISGGSGGGGSVTQGTVPWVENISQWGGTTTTMGQKLMATSVPVVIASDQSTLTTVIAAGAAAIGTVTALEGGTWTTQSVQAGTWTTQAIQSGAPWSQNLTQVGGAAVALGSTTGASSIPVVIASDQSTYTVKALEAGTWTVQSVQAGAPWSQNLTQVGGAAIALGSTTGASSIPVVIASNQATITTVLAAGSAAVGTVTALQGGTWTANVDATLVDEGTFTQGATKFVAVGGFYTTAVTNLTANQAGALQLTADRFMKVTGGLSTLTLNALNSASTLNTTQLLLQNGNNGVPAFVLQYDTPGPISAGQLTIQGTFDNSNWVTVPVNQVLNPNTFVPGSNPYNLVGTTNQPFLVLTQGYQSLRINLTTTITGTGVLTPFVTLMPYAPVVGQNLAQVGGTAVVLGQAVKATSVPVVIASDQSTLTTVIAAGAAAIGTVTALEGGTWTVQSIEAGTWTVQAVQAGAPWSQNITQVNGATLALGQATMAASLPVAIASNQSAVPFNLSQVGATTYGLGQKVAATSMSVVVASDQSTLTTVIAAGTNAIGTVTAIQNGTWAVNLTQYLGQALLTAGVNGLPAIGGAAAASTAVSGYPLLQGGRAQTGEIAAVGDGNAVSAARDVVGKAIIIPYANKENFTSGLAIIGNTTTATTVIAAVNSTTKLYVTGVQLGNNSASTIIVTFNDGAASQFILPSGGGSNISFLVPLVFAANTAVLAKCSTAINTAYVTAQGYKGV